MLHKAQQGFDVVYMVRASPLILGKYIAVILEHLKDRPEYLVRDTSVGGGQECSDDPQ